MSWPTWPGWGASGGGPPAASKYVERVARGLLAGRARLDAAMMEPLIVLENLHKRYGPVEAVRGVSFAVRAGEVFGLLGVNGAGKTTTLECLSGLRTPEAGSVRIAGIDVLKNPRAARARIGVVLPMVSLPEQVTPAEALRLFGVWRGDRRDPRVWLERFGLAAQADEHVGALSQGQRQRLNLALACQGEPAVMLLDEPSNNLDPQARYELQEEIRRLKAGGRAVVLATHLLDEAERLCDRVAILDHGRIMAEGAPRELAERGGRRQRVRLELDGAVQAGAWTEGAGIEDAVVTENVLTFATSSAARALAVLLPELERQGLEVRSIEARPATLEETFLRLTGERSGQPRVDARGHEGSAGGGPGDVNHG